MMTKMAADLNARTNDGFTAFMIACGLGHKDVVKLLLDYSERIELNARNDCGETALMIACRFGLKDIVKLFLAHSDSSIDFKCQK